ncbi:MAG: type IX secretion system membrane protein PorP/SprF [Bacteroidota bacterium]
MAFNQLCRLIIIGLIITPGAYAQQEVMFTQYMFNGLALNPAYAGSHDVVSATAIARQQWVGLEGAPSTQTFSLHSPVFNDQIGMGLMLLHDQIGITNQYNATLSYAYRIPLSHGKLAMGLRAGINSYHADYGEVGIDNDDAFNQGNIQVWQPNFGAGLYYYNQRFYLGASVPQLLEETFNNGEIGANRGLVRHYFLSTGYVFDLNDDLKLKPNALVKMVEGAPVQFDINANLLIMEVLWLGISWRSFDSVDALLQLQLTDRLQLGYSYDFATSSEIRSVNGGSHELSLNYRFTIGHQKSVSPRYF